MRTCINECKTGHAPDCTETETHKACQLVEATRGLICERCYTDLRDALIQASDIVFHLRSIYGILRSRSTDGSQKVKKEPPAPFNLSAYELSEDIYRVIVGRTILVTSTPAGIAAELSKDITANSASTTPLSTLPT